MESGSFETGSEFRPQRYSGAMLAETSCGLNELIMESGDFEKESEVKPQRYSGAILTETSCGLQRD
jgi:hypothetical protein